MTHTSLSQNITNTANRKLNIIRTLSQNNFSNELATLITTYKQFIRPTLNYASPAWYPATSPTNIEKLQKNNIPLFESSQVALEPLNFSIYTKKQKYSRSVFT